MRKFSSETSLRAGSVDISDLRNDAVVQWQHQWYFPILALTGYAAPTIIPGVLWGDWKGGFYFAACLRLTVAHHVSC
jgi:stearoyl-CoA desaturase (Delta-9 desaturase)